MRAAFYTFGCKLNQYETEALASAFRSRGFFIVPWNEKADIYVINTCTVTSKSEQKARRIIRKIAGGHPESRTVITGCYAQVEREYLEQEFPGSIVLPQEDKTLLLEWLDTMGGPENGIPDPAVLHGHREQPDPFAFDPKDFQYHSRAYLKIQDGCNNRCAYCRVPLARGNSVSLDPDRAVERIRRFEDEGYGEAVITGVNITAYMCDGLDLPGILTRLLRETKDLRFRLSSLEPDMLSGPLVSLLADERIRPHFHLPVQSGSDRVLKLMKRKYSSDTVRKGVRDFRRVKDDPFVAADVIVGFPGETEDDFRKTESLLRELAFSKLHVFQYSPRPGTEALNLLPKVPERTAKERSEILLQYSEDAEQGYAAKWTDKEVEGIAVGITDGDCTLLTENYISLHADLPEHDRMELGRRCIVRIEGTAENRVRGRIISVRL